MTGEEKRMERPEKYRDGRKDHHQGGGSKKGIPVLYQQFERKYRTVEPAVRGHWSVESMRWHLDVTFKEDANTTLDKQTAQNLNMIRKWCLSLLKMVELFRSNISMKKKRFVISMDPA